MFVFGPNVGLEIHFTKLSYTVIDTGSSSVAFANFGQNVFKFIIGECLSTFREDVEAKMWAPAQKTKNFQCETSETMLYSVSTCPKKSVNSHCKWADMRRQSNQHFVGAFFFDACHNNRFIEKTSMDRGGEQFFETRSSLSSLDAFSAMEQSEDSLRWCLPFDDFHKSKDVKKSAPTMGKATAWKRTTVCVSTSQ